MAPPELILSKKLDELESELISLEEHKERGLPLPSAASLRAKLSFVKSLFAAEPSAASSAVAARLSRISGRISAVDPPKIESCAENPKPSVDLNHALLRNKLEELESMADSFSAELPQPLCRPNAAKILSKIAFAKRLLAGEAESGQLSSIGARLAAVEACFDRLNGSDATPRSCSRTSSSCRAEELEEGDLVPWIVSLRRKIGDLEQGVGGEGYADSRRKIRFYKSLLAAEMNWKGGEKEEGDFESIVKRFSTIDTEFDDDDRGNVSSPCSCTSSCFDGGQEEREKGEEEKEGFFGVSKPEEDYALEVLEVTAGKSEMAVSENGSVAACGSGGGRRFSRLRVIGAMLGVFVVAGVVLGSYFSEVAPVILVPT